MATQSSSIWKGVNNLHVNHRTFTDGPRGSFVPFLKIPAPLSASGSHLGREILPGQPLNKHGHYLLCTSTEHQCSPCWGLWCGSATSSQRLRIIFHKVFNLYIGFFFLKMKNSLSKILKPSNEWEGLVPPGWAGRDTLVRGCHTTLCCLDTVLNSLLLP